MSRTQSDGLLPGISVDFGIFPAEAAIRLYA
jgi:hypothetical protein